MSVEDFTKPSWPESRFWLCCSSIFKERGAVVKIDGTVITNFKIRTVVSIGDCPKHRQVI
jgi:hypothetical protein